jgi:hypothetical protein
MIGRTLAVAAILVVLAGCGSDPTSPSAGTVSVFLTDAPIDLSTVSAVEVTLDRIVLFGYEGMTTDEEGLEMDRPGVSAGDDLTLNLLDFQDGQTVLIAMLDVPPGEYQKLRMYVTEATLVMEDPDDPTLEIRYDIEVPSSKVDVPVSFSVSGGENTEVVLDFDAALSVQVNETQGNNQYLLRPVITPTGVSSS